MKDAYISMFAALAGSAVGALASFTTTWLTLHTQERTSRSIRALTRRENLYGEFIEEAAKAFTDALDHSLDDASKLVHVYALASKLRLFAPSEVLVRAEEVMRQIIDMYETRAQDLHESLQRHEYESLDVLRAFSEACRNDLAL